MYVIAALLCLQEWDKIGSREINPRSEKDSIVSTSEAPYSSIRIEVDAGDLVLYNIKVAFKNGESFSPTGRFEFKNGSRSRTIDLPGALRPIDRIEFSFEGSRTAARSTVSVFGKKSGEPKPEWEVLATSDVPAGTEKASVSVKKDSRCRSIMFEVDGEMEMTMIKIFFSDDRSFSPKTKLEFKPKSPSRVIDLPGEPRAIKRIDFIYGTPSREGKLKIRVYGMAGASDAKWEKLGSREVKSTSEKDTLTVTAKGVFSELRFDFDGNLEIYKIKVMFPNGESWSPDLRIESSRVVSLPKKTSISSIEFFYKGIRGDKAVVTLSGH